MYDLFLVIDYVTFIWLTANEEGSAKVWVTIGDETLSEPHNITYRSLIPAQTVAAVNELHLSIIDHLCRLLHNKKIAKSEVEAVVTNIFQYYIDYAALENLFAAYDKNPKGMSELRMSSIEQLRTRTNRLEVKLP